MSEIPISNNLISLLLQKDLINPQYFKRFLQCLPTDVPTDIPTDARKRHHSQCHSQRSSQLMKQWPRSWQSNMIKNRIVDTQANHIWMHEQHFKKQWGFFWLAKLLHLMQCFAMCPKGFVLRFWMHLIVKLCAFGWTVCNFPKISKKNAHHCHFLRANT